MSRYTKPDPFGDIADMSFDEGDASVTEYADDAPAPEETIEDERARYAGVIRELTEFENVREAAADM